MMLPAARVSAGAMLRRFETAGLKSDVTEWEKHSSNWECLRAAGYPETDLWKMMKEPNSKWKWSTVANRWVPAVAHSLSTASSSSAVAPATGWSSHTVLDATGISAALQGVPAHPAPAAWSPMSASSSAVAPAIGGLSVGTLSEYEQAIFRAPIPTLPWNRLQASLAASCDIIPVGLPLTEHEQAILRGATPVLPWDRLPASMPASDSEPPCSGRKWQ